MGRTEFEDHEFSKSTFSQYESNKCVQVAIRPDAVGLRDSKDLHKTTLCFSIDEWHAFLEGVKKGEFDIP